MPNFVKIGQLSFFCTSAPHSGTFDRPQWAHVSQFRSFFSWNQVFLYLDTCVSNFVKIGQLSFFDTFIPNFGTFDWSQLAQMSQFKNFVWWNQFFLS